MPTSSISVSRARRIPGRDVHVVDSPVAALRVEERVLLALMVDGPARARPAERGALDDPHVLAVDALDVRDPVLVALRRPRGEQVVALGHVRVGIDHSQALGKLHHLGHPISVDSGRRRGQAFCCT